MRQPKLLWKTDGIHTLATTLARRVRAARGEVLQSLPPASQVTALTNKRAVYGYASTTQGRVERRGEEGRNGSNQDSAEPEIVRSQRHDFNSDEINRQLERSRTERDAQAVVERKCIDDAQAFERKSINDARAFDRKSLDGQPFDIGRFEGVDVAITLEAHDPQDICSQPQQEVFQRRRAVGRGFVGSVGKSIESGVSSVGSGVSSGASSVGSAVGKAKGPALVGTAAAAGLAGGVALGSKLMNGRKSPAQRFSRGRSNLMKAVAREAGVVGKEVRRQGFHVGVGDLAMDVHRREGDRRRRSPVEVLLQSLTERRSKD